jgi:hypothetical protein
MAVLRIFGMEAFVWTIVQFRVDETKSALSAWANETEIAEIANRGGTLRDMNPATFIRQTFNLATGGQAALARCNLRAFYTRSWTTFVHELKLYVDAFGTAYVPCNYVSPSNYKLGFTVRSVRMGVMLLNKDDKVARIEFLESLQGWVWDARESEERKRAIGMASKDRYWKNYESFRSKRREKATRKFEQLIANEPDEEKKAKLAKQMKKRFRDADARTAKQRTLKGNGGGVQNA